VGISLPGRNALCDAPCQIWPECHCPGDYKQSKSHGAVARDRIEPSRSARGEGHGKAQSSAKRTIQTASGRLIIDWLMPLFEKWFRSRTWGAGKLHPCKEGADRGS